VREEVLLVSLGRMALLVQTLVLSLVWVSVLHSYWLQALGILFLSRSGWKMED
jgi:hypothetical protein